MNNRRASWVTFLAVTATAMALVATASATTLTSPEGTTYTNEIQGTSSNLRLHGPFVTIECKHYFFAGKIESHGTAVTAGGKVSEMTFEFCNYQKTVLKKGTLEVHSNGALTSSGAEIALHTSIGTCIYTTNGTTMGTLTSNGSGNAIVDIQAQVPRTGGTFLCGNSSTWTGSATITTPSVLVVDK